MILTYRNDRLRKICELPSCNNVLVKKYGIEVAKKLPQRINQLKSFNSLDDVPISPPFRRHKLKGNRNNQFAIDITNQYRLIFIIGNANIEPNNFKEIKCIEIEEVSKHYE